MYNITMIDTDLIFKFEDVPVICHADPSVYTDDDIENLTFVVSTICREILIDKSYVAFDGNPYEKTFMKDDGWRELCEIVEKSGYGRRKMKNHAEVNEAYRAMIICYIEQVFDDLGYDCDNFQFELPKDAEFKISYLKDSTCEWKYYPGKWQTWT